MKAYRFVAWGQPPRLEDVAEPEPGRGEVVVKVGGAGACHSDLHLMEFPEGIVPFELPFTLGHENAGWVHALGDGVRDLEIGEPVAVYGPWGCGRCGRCRRGMENYCDHAAELGAAGCGLGRDGGMAEYQLVPSTRFLVPLGDLDPRDAAPLTDAGLTPYHAIKRSLGLLEPGTTAIVIGVGGLGHLAVQILRALSPARIVALDTDERKLALAREIGADEVIAAGDDAAARIQALTGGLGAELVLDFVGNDATLALAAQVGRVLGHVTVVGLGLGTLPFSFLAFRYECSLATTYWGSVTELTEVLSLARGGKIRARADRFALDDVADAYQRLRDGALDGRAVITPNG